MFLYGDSGTGKSSLVNAGLFPEAYRRGYEPVRVRVQPRAGEELVVEPVSGTGDGGDLLPSVLAPDAEGASQVVLSIAEFERRVRASSAERRTLVVFDQFEEVLTLFDGAPGARVAVAELIARLLREPLPVKLVLAFREDYLGRVKQLLSARPELVDQALRLGPPSARALDAIIRGPFERFPGQYERELDEALAHSLGTALAERFGTGDVSLSEVQAVCLRLWRSPDPAALLAEKGVQGLLEDELGEALDAFAPPLRAAAVALLGEMVTAAGTRNVISAEDLRQRVHEEDDTIAPELLDEALDRLEGDARLVRRERRRDLDLYEITSEFLVPWISSRRDEQRRAQERERYRRRLIVLGAIAATTLVVAAAVVALAIWAFGQRSEAQRREADATSLALAAASSSEPLRSRPDHALALALEAYRSAPRPLAGAAVVRALQAARRTGLRGILPGRTAGAAFSPDGTTLATVGGSGGAGITLWDAASGTRRHVLHPPDAGSLVAFTPDGRTLAVAGTIVTLWDVASGEPRGRFGRFRVELNAIDISPDGRTLVAAGFDSTVGLWDLRSRSRRGALRGHDGPVFDVKYRPGGTIVTAGSDRTVRFWDAATAAQRELFRPPKTVFELALSRDGKTLATYSNDDSSIVVWNLTSGRRRRLPTTFPVALAISPDGRTLATGERADSARLWDVATLRPEGRLRTGRGQVGTLAFSPDGRTLVAGGNFSGAVLWDPDAPRTLDPVAGSPPFAFSPDGTTLASAGRAGAVRLLDPATGTPRSELPGHGGVLTAMAYRPDGRVLAIAGSDRRDVVSGRDRGTVRLADARTGKRLAVLDRHRATLELAFSPDGRTLATLAFDSRVRLWDTVRHRLRGIVARGDDPLDSIAFSPDSAVIATASANHVVRLWSARTFKQLASFTSGTDSLQGLSISPDGRILAVSGTDGAVLLWSMRSRRPLGRLRGTAPSVLDTAFSPDGRTLATGGSDGTVRLWDIETRTQRGRIAGAGGSVYAVAFAPDGTTLGAAAGTHVRLWRNVLWSGQAQLRAVVCDHLFGWPSRAEWAQYAPGIAYRRDCP